MTPLTPDAFERAKARAQDARRALWRDTWHRLFEALRRR
jgi:hypothetical protein